MNDSNRPVFSLNVTVQEFDNHYWYKTELIDICRRCRLPVSGTKGELEARIRNLLKGERVDDARRAAATRRQSRQLQEITPETRLIPEGFKFNRQAREFFAAYFKRDKFSFTKEMAAALREAERNDDHDMTVADLIAVYEGKRRVDNPDESSYQWNRFVQDFNRDPQSRQIGHNRMRIAAELWKQVRDNPGDKRYSPELLTEYLNRSRQT